LKDDVEAQQALQYLFARGVTQEQMGKFGIGLTPKVWGDVSQTKTSTKRIKNFWLRLGWLLS